MTPGRLMRSEQYFPRLRECEARGEGLWDTPPLTLEICDRLPRIQRLCLGI
jgi:hypothetical protein